MFSFGHSSKREGEAPGRISRQQQISVFNDRQKDVQVAQIEERGGGHSGKVRKKLFFSGGVPLAN